MNTSVGSGYLESRLGLSEERSMMRYLLDFLIVLALFLLWFNLVPYHSDLSHHIHTYISYSITLSFIQLYHIALCLSAQLMGDTHWLDFI